ncbi:MAG: RidA family protein [Blastocatellales bacterium]
MVETTIKSIFIASLILLSAIAYSSERKVIVPANAPKPVGPYSPGIFAGDYLYVSGQGVRDSNGAMPEGVAAQTRQCLENVKAIVEAAGLTMEHVVHMQLYLEKIGWLSDVDRVYAEYFPKNPPARVVIGTAKMPTDTTVEMTVVAVRDLKMKKTLALKSLKPLGHASSAIETGNRVYLSTVYGKTQAEAEAAMKKVLTEARLKNDQIVFRNDYGASAPAMIPMNELPNSAAAAISAIAARKGVKRANGSASFCAADGGTIFCSVQTGIGTHANEMTLQAQVQAVMKKLQAGLAAHGADLSHTVATNVYLNDIREFKPMNETYATFFSNSPPTRTTVQPDLIFPHGNPPLVRISLVAVKE